MQRFSTSRPSRERRSDTGNLKIRGLMWGLWVAARTGRNTKQIHSPTLLGKFTMIRGIVAFVGRAMICAIFVASALMNKIPNFEATVERMSREGIPEPKLMLVGAIVFLLLGSLLVTFGVAARLGALLLLVFLAAATYYFHDFWTIDATQKVALAAKDISGAAARTNEMIHFMKNVAIGGALLVIISRGVSWRSHEIDDGYLD